ncbi:MAG: hypothetical protein R2705_07885 [Ilumatobacteraceae bacterium]
MITATALCKSYQRLPVVRDVSLRCEPGPSPVSRGQRRRQVHHAEDDRRTGATRFGYGDDRRPTVRRAAQPDAVVGTLLDAPAMHPGRSGRSTIATAAWPTSSRGGSTNCWISSG